ncbi:MAG: SCP2 sterol-binding domain-containing protein [Desulfobacteraceae bacterium]
MSVAGVEEVFYRIPDAFDPERAKGLDAVFQFEITGEGGGSWHVVVQDGACRVERGTHSAPRVTLTMSAEDWLAMINRELNGMKAFMMGKLKVSGDLMLAQRIYDLFRF